MWLSAQTPHKDIDQDVAQSPRKSTKTAIICVLYDQIA